MPDNGDENPLEETVHDELTDERRTKYTEYAIKYLDADEQSRKNTLVGEKIHDAYKTTTKIIPKLHEGKDYSEDFETEEYKKAKKLFDKDKEDYVHDKEQAEKVATEFMLNILKSKGTKVSKAIIKAYDASKGQPQEDRFNYLKSSFHDLMGLDVQRIRDHAEHSIDTLVAQMRSGHRAKALMQDFGNFWKKQYAQGLASKKLHEYVHDNEVDAYKKFITDELSGIGMKPKESEVAFHGKQDWYQIHSQAYNHREHEHPHRLQQRGIHPKKASN